MADFLRLAAIHNHVAQESGRADVVNFLKSKKISVPETFQCHGEFTDALSEHAADKQTNNVSTYPERFYLYW